jgi:hypothetical protein
MPRHPPCALHSLSHKHSTKNTNYKDRHPHTPNQQHAECQICDKPWCRPAARCSRPLFTDQEPHPPTPTDNHTVTDRRRRPRQHAPTPHPTTGTHHGHPTGTHSRGKGGRRLIPQGPTVCQPPPTQTTPPRFHTHPRQLERATRDGQY